MWKYKEYKNAILLIQSNDLKNCYLIKRYNEEDRGIAVTS